MIKKKLSTSFVNGEPIVIAIFSQNLEPDRISRAADNE